MGDRETMRFTQANTIADLYILGDWDASLVTANAFIEDCERGAPHRLEYFARFHRAAVALGRGELDAALDDLERSREIALRESDVWSKLDVLSERARAQFLLGRIDSARDLASEVVRMAGTRSQPLQYRIALLCLYAEELGILSEMLRIVEAAPSDNFSKAATAALAGDFREAAVVYTELGANTGEAESRLRAAAALAAAGRMSEADVELEKALDFYRSVDATFFIERAEKLVETTTT